MLAGMGCPCQLSALQTISFQIYCFFCSLNFFLESFSYHRLFFLVESNKVWVASQETLVLSL